jgi:hypothetical protein
MMESGKSRKRRRRPAIASLSGTIGSGDEHPAGACLRNSAILHPAVAALDSAACEPPAVHIRLLRPLSRSREGGSERFEPGLAKSGSGQAGW